MPIYVDGQAPDAEAARRKGLRSLRWRGYGTLELLMKHAPEGVFESADALEGIARGRSQGT